MLVHGGIVLWGRYATLTHAEVGGTVEERNEQIVGDSDNAVVYSS